MTFDIPIKYFIRFNHSDDDKFERVFANDTADVLHNLIDFKLPVHFIIHGYFDGFNGGFLKTGNIGWQDSMARAMSKVMQSNVCAVDWSRLATYPYGITAFSHTHRVSDHVHDFIKVLEVNGADVGKMVIVGHSLGAQIAGFVGGKLDGKLLAIYGLDPAGPGFSFPFNDSPAYRLDPTDAKYVQCIHTSRLTLGVNYNCGHADFFPNGGYTMPGCIGFICSHLYVVPLFRSSIDKSHPFVGTHCPSDFLARIKGYQCSAIRDLMGIHNNGVRGTFYMYTAPNEPYCLNCMTTETSESMKVQPRHLNLERHRPSNAIPSALPEPPVTPIIPIPSLPSLPNVLPTLLSAPFNWLIGFGRPVLEPISIREPKPSSIAGIPVVFNEPRAIPSQIPLASNPTQQFQPVGTPFPFQPATVPTMIPPRAPNIAV